MGLEPTTFCMASRRSSQLSYIRAGASLAAVLRGSRCGAAGNALAASGVQRLVHEPVGELVVLAAHRGPAHPADLARQA